MFVLVRLIGFLVQMLHLLLVVLIFSVAAFILGGALSFAAERFADKNKNPLTDEIEKALPGAQCGQCGYIGCREYAAAVARGEAPVNLCSPGGDSCTRALAELMHVPVPARNVRASEELVALIDQEKCIGCTKCSKACPYDSITGKLKEKHWVDPSLCMGCEKCLPVCPAKCIAMKPLEPTTATWNWQISGELLEIRNRETEL